MKYLPEELTPLKFIILGLGMHVMSIVFAVIGTLILGKVIGGGDSIGALGLGILGAIIGYYAGIIISFILIRRFFLTGGRVMLGSIIATLWIILGYLAGLGFAEINWNPLIVLVIFLATLPFLSLFVYSLKR